LEFIAGRRWSGSLFPLTPEYIAAGDVWIRTGTDGQIAGFVGAGTPRCAGAHLDLNKLVHRSGGGIGRALLRGPTRHGSAARTADDPLADPNATRFYERNNGARIGGSPSDAGAPAACSRGGGP